MRSSFLLVALLTGTAHANEMGQGIHVRQIAAPESPLPKSVKSIAVGKVEGQWASDLSAQLTAALEDADRKYPGETQGAARAAGQTGAMLATMAASALTFGLAANATHEAVTKDNEKKLEAKVRRIDDGLVVMPYKVVTSGADATIGAVVAGEYNDNTFTSTERRTTDGVSYDATVLCTKREVSLTVAWTVTDKSGKTLAKDTADLSTSRSACDDDVRNLPTAKTIAATQLTGFGETLVNRIAPGFKDLRIDLDTHKAVTDALKSVKAGDLWEGACKAHAAVEADPKNHIALYDQGAILEALGHLDDAVASYDAALGLKKHKGAEKGRDRAETRKGEIDVLTASYGMTYTVGAVDWGACEG